MAVTHVAYEQSWYRKAEDCLRAIRFRTEHGWQVSELRGPDRGPFVVVFRRSEGESYPDAEYAG
jgi:hypothetical protein